MSIAEVTYFKKITFLDFLPGVLTIFPFLKFMPYYQLKSFETAIWAE
jgi:hypothetical protein